MDELITSVANSLGIEPALAKKSLGAILKFVQEQSPADIFAKIASLPGVADAMKEPEAETAVRSSKDAGGSGGIIGLVFNLLKTFGILAMLKEFVASIPGLGDSAVKMIESVEDGAELTVLLQKFGIDRSKGIQMVKMLIDFVESKLDGETIEKLKDQIPALGVFLGESKKEE